MHLERGPSWTFSAGVIVRCTNGLASEKKPETSPLSWTEGRLSTNRTSRENNLGNGTKVKWNAGMVGMVGTFMLSNIQPEDLTSHTQGILPMQIKQISNKTVHATYLATRVTNMFLKRSIYIYITHITHSTAHEVTYKAPAPLKWMGFFSAVGVAKRLPKSSRAVSVHVPWWIFWSVNKDSVFGDLGCNSTIRRCQPVSPFPHILLRRPPAPRNHEEAVGFQQFMSSLLNI